MDDNDSDEYHLAAMDGVVCAHCGDPLDDDGRCARCEAETHAHEGDKSGIHEVDANSTSGSRSGSHVRTRRKPTWAEWIGLEDRREGEIPIHYYLIALLIVALVAGGWVLVKNPAATAWWTGLPLTIMASIGLCGSYVWMRRELETGFVGWLAAPLAALFQMIRLKTTPTTRLASVRFAKWCLLAAALGIVLMLLSRWGR